MPVAFPLSIPSHDTFQTFSLVQTDIVAQNVSPFTGTSEILEHPGKLWAGKFSWVFDTREEAAPYYAFLTALRGRRGTFLMGDPLARTAMGVATGAPVVNGAGQTGLTLSTSGWTPDTPQIMKATDYITIGEGESVRLYMLTQDADSDSSGNAELDIWPNLRQATVGDETIEVNNTVGTFRLENNVREMKLDPPYVHGWSVNFREAL